MKHEDRNGLEQEVKFELDDFRPVRRALAARGASCAGRWLERNVVLDDAGRSLTHRGQLLRLRQGASSKLTFKSPPDPAGPGQTGPESGRFKVMREIETLVSDPEALGTVFAALGYEPVLRYEKVRETWRLGRVKACLDLLPFGRFLELEGPPDEVVSLAPLLGLDMDRAMALTYHDLNRRARGANARNCPDFVFDATVRDKALTNEGLALLMQSDGEASEAPEVTNR